MSMSKRMAMMAFLIAVVFIAVVFVAGFNVGVHHAIEDAYICVEDAQVVIDLDGNEYIHVIE